MRRIDPIAFQQQDLDIAGARRDAGRQQARRLVYHCRTERLRAQGRIDRAFLQRDASLRGRAAIGIDSLTSAQPGLSLCDQTAQQAARWVQGLATCSGKMIQTCDNHLQPLGIHLSEGTHGIAQRLGAGIDRIGAMARRDERQRAGPDRPIHVASQHARHRRTAQHDLARAAQGLDQRGRLRGIDALGQSQFGQWRNMCRGMQTQPHQSALCDGTYTVTFGNTHARRALMAIDAAPAHL